MLAGTGAPGAAARPLAILARRLDVGITIDIMDAAPRVDEVVLASGDGDFDLLLDKIRGSYGVEAVAYGVPGLTAQSLVRAASRYVPIEGSLLLRN